MGIGEEVFLYAVPKRLGYFKAEGLEVDIQNSQTGMISAQVLQSNSAQVGTTAAAAIMTVREQNGDLVSFFNLKRNAGTFLVVLKDSPIQKLEDLKGRTIGAPSFGAGGGLGLKQNLSEIGITPDQYTGISTGAGPSAIAALRTGQIDALVMWDAMLGAAENTGLALRTVNIPLEDGQVGTTLAVTEILRQRKSKGRCRLLPRHDQGPVCSRDQPGSRHPHVLGRVSDHETRQPGRRHRAQEQRAHHEPLPRKGAARPARGRRVLANSSRRTGRTRTPPSSSSAR